MRVKFIGHNGTRTLGPYTWNADNDWIQDVTDPEILEDLRSYPHPQWKFLDPDEDLPGDKPVTAISGIGPGRAEELAGLEIHTVSELVEAGADHLSLNTGASRAQVEGWLEQANKMMEADNG